jgi:hypothetical protein
LLSEVPVQTVLQLVAEPLDALAKVAVFDVAGPVKPHVHGDQLSRPADGRQRLRRALHGRPVMIREEGDKGRRLLAGADDPKEVCRTSPHPGVRVRQRAQGELDEAAAIRSAG